MRPWCETVTSSSFVELGSQQVADREGATRLPRTGYVHDDSPLEGGRIPGHVPLSAGILTQPEATRIQEVLGPLPVSCWWEPGSRAVPIGEGEELLTGAYPVRPVPDDLPEVTDRAGDSRLVRRVAEGDDRVERVPAQSQR
jgi:hypothetical protein